MTMTLADKPHKASRHRAGGERLKTHIAEQGDDFVDQFHVGISFFYLSSLCDIHHIKKSLRLIF